MNDSDRLKILNEAVPFAFDELFFSRTDERGIIISGNSVFQRISQYNWDELIKKPHNLIRHPDMPKAVFWLLWNTIKKGEPIGAYVKNRAKDGRYYWVFAIVTPIEGGYLSVRLKPGSPILSIVEQEYQKLVTLENTEKLPPENSGVILLGQLSELGFSQYKYFMSAALSTEIKEFDKQLDMPTDLNIASFDKLLEEAKALLQQADNIFAAYENSKYVPLNLRIHAAQLGDAGSTIGVISSNYNIISTEIKNNLNQFMELASLVFDTINEGLFLSCVARMQREVVELFQNEQSDNIIDKNHEMQLLKKQQATYQQKSINGLRQITHKVKSFNQSCIDMKKLSTGLEVTRIMGKVESARITSSQDSLSGLIDDLDIFQNSVAKSLKEIEDMNKLIEQNIDILLTLQKANT